MRACPLADEKEGKDGKTCQRVTMAGQLTGWHFSLSCAGFGPESPVLFAWLIISLGPNFQLEISQSKLPEQAASAMQSSLVTAPSGGSNSVGPSGVLLWGGFQEQDVHASAPIV